MNFNSRQTIFSMREVMMMWEILYKLSNQSYHNFLNKNSTFKKNLPMTTSSFYDFIVQEHYTVLMFNSHSIESDLTDITAFCYSTFTE